MIKRSNKLSKPKWLKTDIPRGKRYFDVKNTIASRKLVTVCEEAKCPNISQCWNVDTATFMLLGDTCTRACRFCHIKTAATGVLDPQEGEKIADSCKSMGIKYVVLTMVDRDDLEDGGAEHICKSIKLIQQVNKGISVEVLAGDFSGQLLPLKNIVDCSLQVFAHNVETIRRLTPRVRDNRASYQQSLEVLRSAKYECKTKIYTKTSLMLGFDEKRSELLETLADILEQDVDIITFGQYMQPTKKHLSVKRWVHPDEFKELEAIAYKMGFKGVVSGPLVRSSYLAGELYDSVQKRLMEK